MIGYYNDENHLSFWNSCKSVTNNLATGINLKF